MGEVAASYSGLPLAKKLKRAADIAAHRIVAKAKATVGLAKKPRIQVIQDFSELAHVDEHVINTPASAEETPESLAEYLASGAQTDLEKARAAYKWITANISYDADGFYGKKPRLSPQPEEVLKNRCCVCNGYAKLMARLCQLMDVECKEIIGYAKGSDYNQLEPDLASTDPDHAWNAVKLDGSWRLVEATWGAGSMNFKQQFVRAETDFYFLTDPEIFAESHFPYMDADMEASKKWQLLKKPIDLDTFHRQARRSRECLECEVELLSHNQALIDVEDGEVTLRFRGAGKPLRAFGAKFVDGAPWDEKYMPNKHAIVVRNHRTNEATVIARPPTTGTYWELIVFGATDSQSTVRKLVSYHIRTQQEPEGPVFPDSEFYYGLYENPVDFGFTQDFPQSGFQIQADGGRHELTIPIAGRMRAKAKVAFAEDAKEGERITAVEVSDKMLTVRVRMCRPGHYALNLFCMPKDSAANRYDHVARFLIECQQPLAESMQFPPILRDFYGLCCDPKVFGLPDDFYAGGEFVINAESGEHDLTLPVSSPITASVKFRSGSDCKKDNKRFALIENLQGYLRICLRMCEPGFHCLDLFCQKTDSQEDGKLDLLATFLIECREPMSMPRPFPDTFGYPDVVLESPRYGDLPANCDVEFRLSSEALNLVLVNESVHEKKSGSFNFTVRTGSPGSDLPVYGVEDSEATSFLGLYRFRVV